MNRIKIGIIGAGRIAHTMGDALAAMDDAELYAIASRSPERGKAFAAEYYVPRVYDNYEAMVQDDDVDLVYVATPHSHHYQHARLAIEHGKPVLVEKAFTANAHEAEQLIAFAHERGVFITEAIWTRYLPMSHKVKELLDTGIIGEPRLLTATLCYMMEAKQRLWTPDLCGGALLDVGVYTLNFARMYFGTDIVKMVSNVVMDPRGVDAQEAISLTYADGKMANLQAGALTLNDRQGIISGTEGYLRVDNVNCPTLIEVYRTRDLKLVERIERPADMINGFEYQVRECKRCIEQGLTESPMMPHAETIDIMRQMDTLRKEWGVVYPMD